MGYRHTPSDGGEEMVLEGFVIQQSKQQQQIKKTIRILLPKSHGRYTVTLIQNHMEDIQKCRK